ncbi:MAG TPA: Calx-beta domain-containing protein [Solirubrobacteraceae bacterium]|nr:Calx-beta domain-containing protein [Solirubrobacteraceae bacterium]
MRAYVEPCGAVSRLFIVACALVALAAAAPAAASAASITIDDVTPLEGNSGTTTANFVVHLSANAPAGGVTVNYTTQNGSATAPADYTAASGTATIAEGTSTAVIPIQIVGDTLSEGNETFTVKLSNASGSNTITDDTATGTIIDDDPLPSLRVNDVSVTEGNTGTRNATFTVTQSAPAGRDVTVHYGTSDGSAKAPADYMPVSGTLTIPAGSTSRTVTVPVRGDTIDENTETFNLNLSSASGASIADSRGVGTIRDDDGAPRMTVDDGRVREGDRGLTRMLFVVRLSQVSGKTITVRYATERRSAISGSDYQGTSGTLTIPAGAATGVVAVNVIGDTRPEADENFNLRLSGAHNTSLRDSLAVGTIINDDFPPRLSSFRVSPSVFRAAGRGGSVAARPIGTTVRFRLSRAAPVVFHVQRAQLGRRVGRACVAPRRSNRRRPACVRYVTLRGSFTVAGRAGANVFRFTGRLRNRKLAPARYRLVAEAGTAGLRSPARAVRFRIVP